jgi:hypothetical protein
MLNRASSLSISLIASVLMANPSCAHPRSVHEWFQEQSDYVVIARAREQKQQLGFDKIPIEIATLEIMSVLKGQIGSNTIEVVVKSESMDQTANCCKSGKTYLMYLMKHNGQFTLIRGRDGVFLLEALHFKGRRR